jgi:YfiH family protein
LDIVCEAKLDIYSWSLKTEHARFLFTGKGSTSPTTTLAAFIGKEVPVSFATQVHGTRVVSARTGDCGEADGIRTGVQGQPVSVQTADCVPVLMASSRQVAAVHAGWKGLRDGILAAAMRTFDRPVDVVIGPHIGACCYEVGKELAEEMAKVVDESIVVPLRPRPHLDLGRAAEIQLTAAGANVIAHVGACTRCSPNSLWSYRRDGPGAGRNLAFAWIE